MLKSLLGDAVLLQNMFNIELGNCRELSLMAKLIDDATWSIPRGFKPILSDFTKWLELSANLSNDIALSKLCSKYLHRELKKTLATSDWSAASLTDAQLHCAR